MLELGYELDIQAVMAALREHHNGERQTVLLSATLTKGIQQLSQVSLRHPTFVDAAVEGGGAVGAQVEPGDGDRSLVIPENITQTFLLVPAKLRLVALALFVFWKRAKKMLVFLATQDMVDFYRKVLEILFIGPEEVVEEKEEDDELTEEAKLVVGRDSLKKAVANRSPGLDPSLKLF